MFDKRLQTFETVANLGSLSRAAKMLSLSSAAVIKQVNQLEQMLGVKMAGWMFCRIWAAAGLPTRFANSCEPAS